MSELENKTLLYAEDEQSLNDQYTKYFTDYFQEVYSAFDGEEALDLFEVGKPDVLILDIAMPKLSGLDVAKRIREENKDICIVLLTALGDKETLKKAIELGLTTYVEKPLTRMKMSELLEKVEKTFKDTTKINVWLVDDEYYIWKN
jgi:DNA-binding response OmpR family regulator